MCASEELPDGNLPARRQEACDTQLGQIQDSLRGLRYGSVQIIVQDGVIVQIDRTEKRRLRQTDKKARG